MSTKYDGPGKFSCDDDKLRIMKFVTEGMDRGCLVDSDQVWMFIGDELGDDEFVIEFGVLTVSRAILQKFNFTQQGMTISTSDV